MRRLMSTRLLHTVLTACILLGIGCLSDAERSNPLDPLSDDFEDEGTLTGMTTRFYPPHPAVRNAEVKLTPGPFITESDADGRFEFLEVPSGRYQITARKNGFISGKDSVTVVAGTSNRTVDLRLNGLPVVHTFELRAVHIDRWWPGELYQLEVAATIEDPDGLGDIDRVWFEIPEFGYAQDLKVTAISGRYQETISAQSLPGGNLHALQGKEIVVKVIDKVGFAVESAPRQIVRVIDMTPIAISPQAQEQVDDPAPLLVWEDAGLPFAYTYRIDVVLDQVNVQNVVQTITNIPAERTSYKLETPLASGTYFWTISVVDAFGNRSRSKEAGFLVP